MIPIFVHTLRGQRWPVLVTSLALAALGFLLAASYESLGQQGLEFLGESMPRAIAALLKTEGSLLISAGPEGYLAIGFRHPLVLIVVSAFAVAGASSAVAREIERRTILLLLARPIPRYYLVLGKGATSVIALASLVAALLAGTFVGVYAQGLGDSVAVGPFLIISANALALGLAVLGYSYLISAYSSDGGSAILWSTALTVVLFFIDFVAGLLDVLEPLGLLSLFHYYDPVAVAVDTGFPAGHFLVLLGVATATFAGAAVYFQRRDISA